MKEIKFLGVTAGCDRGFPCSGRPFYLLASPRASSLVRSLASSRPTCRTSPLALGVRYGVVALFACSTGRSYRLYIEDRRTPMPEEKTAAARASSAISK